MNDIERDKKLDDLLRAVGDLRPQPDFLAWQRKHPQAVQSILSLPTVTRKRRFLMIRIARYGASAAACLLIILATGWWAFFGRGTGDLLADVIKELGRIQSASCMLHMHLPQGNEVYKVYMAGSRVRVENSTTTYTSDFREGKALLLDLRSKKASIVDMLNESGRDTLLTNNPLDDLLKLKDATAKRLPNEVIQGTQCEVYRVDNPVFMGSKRPWLKLWVDRNSHLPLQVHWLLNGQFAMTYNDFHWNEQFDVGLMALVPPKGYTLAEKPKELVSDDTISLQTTSEGREIKGEELAKTLDMLAVRIEENYKALKSWSGTYVVEQRLFEDWRAPMSPRWRVSKATLRFYALPDKDHMRTDYKETEPVQWEDPKTGTSVGLPPPVFFVKNGIQMRLGPVTDSIPTESRWVRTPNDLLRFPLSEMQKQVKDFPSSTGAWPGKEFRVVYREGPETAMHYDNLRQYIDPLIAYKYGMPEWQVLSWDAKAIRGQHNPEEVEWAKKHLSLRVLSKGSSTQYILTTQPRPLEARLLNEETFSSEANFNTTSSRLSEKGHLVQARTVRFRKENGVLIPSHIECDSYQNPDDQGSTCSLMFHRALTLNESHVNGGIEPSVFEVKSLGLRYGDHMADWIEHRLFVYDGTKLVPAEEFKLQTPAQTKRDDPSRPAD